MRNPIKLGMKVLKVTVLIFTIITIFIISIQVYDNKESTFLLTSVGIKNLLNYFEPSIKFLAALIGLFAVWITIERLSQTDKRLIQADQQLGLIRDNNDFNNFVIHKREFIEYFKMDDLVKNQEKISHISGDKILSSLYQSIYYRSYAKFQPIINDNFQSEIVKIFQRANDLKFEFDSDILDDELLGSLKVFLFQSDSKTYFIAKDWDHPHTSDIRRYGHKKYGFSKDDLDKFEKIIVSCRTMYTMLRFYLKILYHDGNEMKLDHSYINKVRAFYIDIAKVLDISIRNY